MKLDVANNALTELDASDYEDCTVLLATGNQLTRLVLPRGCKQAVVTGGQAGHEGTISLGLGLYSTSVYRPSEPVAP